MDNLEYIESYFKGSNTDQQKRQFEKKIVEDAAFAEDVAFYISANGLVKEQLHAEKKQMFRDLYEQQEAKVISIRRPLMNLRRYLAAASVFVAVIILSWFLFVKKTSPRELADNYIQQHFQRLPVNMGASDSIQSAKTLYNAQKLTGALPIFEELAQKDSTNDDAKKYAGIVCLKLGNYDKALQYFVMLEKDTSSYSNFGKFYIALTLLKRNKNDDVPVAKKLLREIIEGKNNLEGKEEASEWLKKLD